MATTSADIFKTIEPIVAEYTGLGEKSKTKFYEKVAHVFDSEESIMDLTEYGGPSTFSRKAEMEPVRIQNINQGWSNRWKAATYASGQTISREAAKDTKYDAIRSSSRTQGRGATETPNYQMALFIDEAFTATGAIGDGLALCSTAHTTPSGTTFSNTFTTAIELSEEGIEQAMINMELMVGPDGMPSPIMGKKLVIHPSKAPLAWKLMNTKQQVGSNYNDKSYVAGPGSLEVVSYPHLANQEPWYIITEVTTEDEEGLFYAFRERPTFEREPHVSNLSTIFVGFFRSMWGCKNARGIYGSNAS